MGIRTEYIESFFEEFTLSEDKKNNHFYTVFLKESILEFSKNETKENAMRVYENFFDCYKLKLNETLNFIDLLDVLKNYEENASTLIDKQRDHFIHSVNVFLLGISIYSSNYIFQESYKKSKTNQAIDGELTKEAFFFDWGLASLCHDIGYPIEITNKQIKKFVDIVTRVQDRNIKANPFLDFHNFEAINGFNEKFLENSRLYLENNKDSIIGSYIGNENPIELLSKDISESLGIDYEELKSSLNSFLNIMKMNGFVDHGFYSSIIVLKWYSYFIEITGTNYDVLYNSVLKSSSAILLHNYYKNSLMKKPFELGTLGVDSHPIAFLLILCDELQDWNREAYGIEDKKRACAEKSKIVLSDSYLEFSYVSYKGELEEDFSSKKKASIENVLNINDIYKDGLNIKVITSTDFLIDDIKNNESIYPRLMIENIEKLAKMIHEDYNKQQMLRNPEKILEYPNWESLPQTLKYSNFRQARAITEKLNILGYITSEESCENEIKSFTNDEIEYLARIEHDSWNEERIQNGWKYGIEKDVEKKISPYILPYDELSEEIKNLDRDAVKNIIPLLNKINLKVCKVK